MFENISENLDYNKAYRDLAAQGFHIVNSRMSSDFISASVKAIDNLCADPEQTDKYYEGSEFRIWEAHKKIEAAEQFRLFADHVLQRLAPNTSPAHDILAIHNRPLHGDIKSLSKGRWHLDSFRKQMKVFVFLADVNEDDGPFEMIPGTHKISSKIGNILKFPYFKISDFLNGSGQRSYQKLSDKKINRLISSQPSRKFIVPSGTILIANTSAIHRAHPVSGGQRYAFTSYHR